MSRIGWILFLLSWWLPMQASDLINIQNIDIDVHPALSDTTCIASLPFTVTSKDPVKVTCDKPGCSCMSFQTQSDKVLYQPGDKGLLTFSYEYGDVDGSRVVTTHLTATSANDKDVVTAQAGR